MIDAVGMEAHGAPAAKLLQSVTGLLPDALAAPLTKTAGVDRMAAIHSAIDIVRRGGTISLIGVYAGAADPMPMTTLFDKQIQLRMGQANVLRWVDDIMPYSRTKIRSEWIALPPTICHWTRPPVRTRSSRRRRTALSKW